jgi:hypothetical protein
MWKISFEKIVRFGKLFSFEKKLGKKCKKSTKVKLFKFRKLFIFSNIKILKVKDKNVQFLKDSTLKIV